LIFSNSLEEVFLLLEDHRHVLAHGIG